MCVRPLHLDYLSTMLELEDVISSWRRKLENAGWNYVRQRWLSCHLHVINEGLVCRIGWSHRGSWHGLPAVLQLPGRTVSE
eukprot:COSAG06_NODE_284_length_18336_cov_5.847124_2_plen_81_part_00